MEYCMGLSWDLSHLASLPTDWRMCPLVGFAEATKPGGNGKHWKTFLKKNIVQENKTEVVLKL